MSNNKHINVHESKHPLVAHKISLLRNKTTNCKQFRELVNEISILLAYEFTSCLPLSIQPNLETISSIPYTGHKLATRIALVPILRAGLGLVDGILKLLPNASVLHLGLFREKTTLQPVEYYNKLPEDPNSVADMCIVLDPMIATAGTAVAAINILKDWGIKSIFLVTLCASSYGLNVLTKAHPDVSIYAGVIDEKLNEKGYIVPGLGDAGDRLFKTFN